MRVTILEDEPKVSAQLVQYLHQYGEQNGLEFHIETYSNGDQLLKNYKADADVLFLDIQVPGISGMEVARQVRKNHKDVVIVFVTNLQQYAIEGYEVNAFDFILKPLDYTGFSLKLQRISNEVAHKADGRSITLNIRQGIRKIPVASILYIEVQNHDLILHLDGEDLRIRRTMSSMQQELEPYYFSRCNACYLVNLSRIQEIRKGSVYIGDATLPISKQKNKSFLEDVAKYLGGSV